MKRTNVDKVVEKYFKAKMPKDIAQLVAMAHWDLNFGPAHGYVDGESTANDSTIEWPGFELACEHIKNWVHDELPSEVWVDMDCDDVSEYAPEGYWEHADDQEEKVWVEPNTENTYHLDRKEIKRAVFGELAEYI